MSGKPSGRSLCDALAEFFRERPNRWIDAHVLLTVAGYAAWRTRISDLRKRGMVIENRTKRASEHALSCPGLHAWDIPEACNCNRPRRFMVSEYRYVPADTQTESAA